MTAIFTIILAFVVLGVIGLICKVFGWIIFTLIDWLFDGCGCLIAGIIAVVLIAAFMGLL